ncbi:aminotransferase DegT [Listeria sp. SHR_NRA_18]|uniref:DegT/DnrJ/EryC1/StrS family aminotransferase n=1 Tax=Listeria sp. SHR_NRA_18 TaxID=2269046 RepID=UPI00051CD806|nr:DegT/DnrJ/EryC1/StrS family aminotransferase [Listeria sp. SHR_NRA_18]KGL39147.1 aminotransferase DegT [Listeriaceae bacterium FSL A5-0209]RQW66368.1 aminotransferase DegT [Listeria sp. SHR_NRA_18]
MVDKILLSPPDMAGTELDYIKEAFDTNWIAPVGPHVDTFEEELATYVGAKHAVAVSSGTAGLHLALLAAGVGEGDVVFCQSFTFAASVNPVLYQKAIPVLIDSDYNTWNMSTAALELAFKTRKPKAVIVTHIYGQAADMARIKQLCDANGALLIEDACESLGTTYAGKQTGTIGDIGVYSFNGNKIITTSGGGMVVTDKKEWADQIKYLSQQAKSTAPYYLHETVGYNYRLSNVLAGIGRAQLTTLDDKIQKKRAVFTKYQQAFHSTEVEMMPIDQNGVVSNRWLSVILIPDKNPHDLMYFLEKENIESRLVWNPMHQQPFLKDIDFVKIEDKAVSEELFQSGLCLPSGSQLQNEEQERVIYLIKNYLQMGGE